MAKNLRKSHENHRAQFQSSGFLFAKNQHNVVIKFKIVDMEV